MDRIHVRLTLDESLKFDAAEMARVRRPRLLAPGLFVRVTAMICVSVSFRLALEPPPAFCTEKGFHFFVNSENVDVHLHPVEDETALDAWTPIRVGCDTLEIGRRENGILTRSSSIILPKRFLLPKPFLLLLP